MANIYTADAFLESRVPASEVEREMSLGQIQDRLEENRIAIGLVEAAIAKNPESPSLCANIGSLQKIQKEFEAEWLDLASQSKEGGGGAK